MKAKDLRFGQIIERYYTSCGWLKVKVDGKILNEIHKLGKLSSKKYRLCERR